VSQLFHPPPGPRPRRVRRVRRGRNWRNLVFVWTTGPHKHQISPSDGRGGAVHEPWLTIMANRAGLRLPFRETGEWVVWRNLMYSCAKAHEYIKFRRLTPVLRGLSIVNKKLSSHEGRELDSSRGATLLRLFNKKSPCDAHGGKASLTLCGYGRIPAIPFTLITVAAPARVTGLVWRSPCNSEVHSARLCGQALTGPCSLGRHRCAYSSSSTSLV